MKVVASQRVVNGRLQVTIDLQTKDWREQPRVPAGGPEGGQWGPIGGSYDRGSGPGEGRWNVEGAGRSGKPSPVSKDSGDNRTIVGNGDDWNNYPDQVKRKWKEETEPLLEDKKIGSAVDAYKMQWYGPINEHLREGDIRRGVSGKIKSLDKVTEGEFSEPITVFRGVGGHGARELLSSAERSLRDEGTVEDKGFASTSLDASTAYYFSGAYLGGDSVILQISTKRGTLLSAEASLGHPSESEILLPRNVRMKVVGIDKNVRVYHNGSQGNKGISDPITVIRMEVL